MWRIRISFWIIIYCFFLLSCNSICSDKRDELYKSNIKEYTEEINKNPNDPEKYYRRGINYEILKQYDFALKDFEKAIELKNDFEDAFWKRSLIMLRKENYAESLNSIDKAIQIRGKKIPLVYYTIRGKSYFGLQKADYAIKDHTRVIDAGPDQYYNNNFLDSLYQRAILLSIKKEYLKSQGDLNRLLEFIKPTSNSYFLSGTNFYGLNQTDHAIENFNEAISMNKYSADSYMYLSLCYIKKNDRGQAEDNYIKAIKLGLSNQELLYLQEFVDFFGKEKIYQLVKKYGKQ